MQRLNGHQWLMDGAILDSRRQTLYGQSVAGASATADGLTVTVRGQGYTLTLEADHRFEAQDFAAAVNAVALGGKPRRPAGDPTARRARDYRWAERKREGTTAGNVPVLWAEGFRDVLVILVLSAIFFVVVYPIAGI